MYSSPLTNNKDIDYDILINMKFDQLVTLCQTNKYTYNLCENKQFWINKVTHDYLSLPDKSLLNDVDGMQIYFLCYTITYHIDNSWWDVNILMISDLIKKYVPDYDEELDVDLDDIGFNVIQITAYDKYKFLISFVKQGKYIKYEDSTYFDSQTVINFLFDGLKNGILALYD